MNFQIQRMTEQGFVPPPPAGSIHVLQQLLMESPHEGVENDFGVLESAAWASAIGSELAELYGELEARYRHGETTEDTFLEDFPEYTADVERLKTEQRSILRAVRDILDRLWWADWPDASPQFETMVRETLLRIDQHERAENDLLQRAYTLDLGVAG